MDDKVYDTEEKIAAGCIAFAWLLLVFVLVVVGLMACNWIYSFLINL